MSKSRKVAYYNNYDCATEKEKASPIDHLLVFVCCYETKFSSKQLNTISSMLHKLQLGSQVLMLRS